MSEFSRAIGAHHCNRQRPGLLVIGWHLYAGGRGAGKEYAMTDDLKTCGNCRHWGWMFEVEVTLPDSGPMGRVSIKLAPCLCRAVEADAGDGAVVLLGPDSHCQSHADAWEPSDDFLDELRDAEDYGVRPGVDFPATLRRPVASF